MLTRENDRGWPGTPFATGPPRGVSTIVNEGTVDRAVRIALGVVLLSLVFIGPRTSWGLLGLVPLLTGIFGFCSLYRALRSTTGPRGQPHA